jgi:hypothetical protein
LRISTTAQSLIVQPDPWDPSAEKSKSKIENHSTFISNDEEANEMPFQPCRLTDNFAIPFFIPPGTRTGPSNS